MRTAPSVDELQREVADLRQRLEVSEAIVRAIGQAEVDAFLVRAGGTGEEEVLTVGNADRPYRLLIERMHQGAATVFSDGTILWSNRRLAEMVGSPRSGLGGGRLGDFIASRSREEAAECLARGCREPAELEVVLECEGGSQLPVQLTLSPLLDQSGLACVLVTDLSHQRAQAQERERLVQEQAARTAAEKQSALLREADRRKDLFIATLAHELRNPLAPLRSGLHVLKLARPDEPDYGRTHDILARQVETLVRLVDDLLDVSRLTQGKVQLRRSRFDLREVAARALDSCQDLLGERGHRVETSLPDQAVVVEADEVRVTQALINLLNNAAKYTPRGGTIALRLEAPPGGNQAVFRVRDTGVGISPAMLARIFEPFAQAEARPGTQAGGLGIGLTLTRSLVELHGGSVAASSEGVGRGSEFSLTLPLAGPGPAVSPAAPRARQAAAGRARVLVVDDNRDAAMSLDLLLQRMGHDVRVVHRGREVHGAVLDFAPHVVLLDIGLPDLSGYEVAQQLRADPRCGRVHIVGLSGYAAEQDRERAFASGFDEHRAKPIGLDDLEDLLARAVHARKPPPGETEASAQQG